MAALLRRAQPFLHPIARENVASISRQQWFMSKAYISSAAQGFSTEGRVSDRVFANYNIYKGKAALSASPRLPQFSKLDSGCLKVDRQGTIMLSFSPAIGERKYDWEKKQLFALSATEIGSLISLGPDESCEFFHDPSMKSSNAGQVRKTLQVKPHADGSGYFISLSVVNNVQKISERVTVPVTKAEFAVMRTAFSFALPHIMGWDRYINQPPKSVENSAPMVDPRVKSSEWDR
ncbi:Single-stranded DNA-binding protein WHY2, mitochondrial [Heracleum sosnowskyi]|uniref:Single-stranded DNA-binding protein WHY2, mitochondrial n=1 Tax=Heracleum sosnowskyi TaxID=360622 RepID=A0AAD8J627_9APIA|nr:Single-stranded DNA-binding protein WHY2, mitochondrial [Heracleum sosnowskyi]